LLGMARYFSVGALLGSVFAGLWLGGFILLILQSEFPGSGLSALSYGFEAFGIAALWSLLLALVGVIPASLAMGLLLFPVTRLIYGRVKPTRPNSMALGAAVSAIPMAVVLGIDAIISQVATSTISLLLAAIFGGAIAGLTYRALLVYRYPAVLADHNGAGTAA